MKHQKVSLIILFFVCFNTNTPLMAQGHYLILAYGDSSTTRLNPVLIEDVNFERNEIVHIDTLRNSGYLPERKPFRFIFNGQDGFVSFLEYGIYGKNSNMDTNKVYYYIHSFDTTLNKIRSDSFINVQLDLRHIPGRRSFGFGIKENGTGNYIIPFGEYYITNNGQFQHHGPYNSNIMPGRLGNLGNFKYPSTIDTLNIPSIYYCKKENRSWLIKLNDRRNLILDSLCLQTETMASVVFAYHPSYNRIYCFHLNYEYHSENPVRYKGFGRNWITPEVLIYDPISFRLIERHTVADFSQGNYPNYESGLADVVGDYIVYYFFEEDHYYNFAPAMLFIFDTRTNEARWLRVGWR